MAARFASCIPAALPVAPLSTLAGVRSVLRVSTTTKEALEMTTTTIAAPAPTTARSRISRRLALGLAGIVLALLCTSIGTWLALDQAGGTADVDRLGVRPRLRDLAQADQCRRTPEAARAGRLLDRGRRSSRPGHEVCARRLSPAELTPPAEPIARGGASGHRDHGAPRPAGLEHAVRAQPPDEIRRAAVDGPGWPARRLRQRPGSQVRSGR